jgi:hypothetical protein
MRRFPRGQHASTSGVPDRKALSPPLDASSRRVWYVASVPDLTRLRSVADSQFPVVLIPGYLVRRLSRSELTVGQLSRHSLYSKAGVRKAAKPSICHWHAPAILDPWWRVKPLRCGCAPTTSRSRYSPHPHGESQTISLWL